MLGCGKGLAEVGVDRAVESSERDGGQIIFFSKQLSLDLRSF